MTTDRYTEGATRYTWVMSTPVTSLYGLPVIPTSLVPEGRVMTLRNEAMEELTLRGETHEDSIVFFHIEGGGYEIGAWMPLLPDWVIKLRESFEEVGKR